MIINNYVNLLFLLVAPRKAIAVVALIALMIFLACSQAFSEEATQSGQLSIVFENDVFFRTDQHYTNGTAVVWVPDGTQAPGWVTQIARLMPWFPENALRSMSLNAEKSAAVQPG